MTDEELHRHLVDQQGSRGDLNTPVLVIELDDDLLKEVCAGLSRLRPDWTIHGTADILHAYGTVEFFNDPERLRDVVTRLTDRQEAPRAEPWAVSDAPADYIAGMLKAIVGFELPIARLDGKYKMSQNRPAEDRASVFEGLKREGHPGMAWIVRSAAWLVKSAAPKKP